MKINKENGINKIDDVIKVLRRTNKNSYNINVVYIDTKKYNINIKGDFMQVSKKMTLEDLALIVNNLALTVTTLSETVDQGFKKVNERLDKVELRLDNIEKDVAAIKNCPTIKAELNL